jgi:hypothetical protein
MCVQDFQPHLKPDNKKSDQKKGPLALASGPSLGRKRPRRAAIARGATAPQQYAIALHKVQGFLDRFPCKIRMTGSLNMEPKCKILRIFFNGMGENPIIREGRRPKKAVENSRIRDRRS